MLGGPGCRVVFALDARRGEPRLVFVLCLVFCVRLLCVGWMTCSCLCFVDGGYRVPRQYMILRILESFPSCCAIGTKRALRSCGSDILRVKLNSA